MISILGHASLCFGVHLITAPPIRSGAVFLSPLPWTVCVGAPYRADAIKYHKEKGIYCYCYYLSSGWYTALKPISAAFRVFSVPFSRRLVSAQRWFITMRKSLGCESFFNSNRCSYLLSPTDSQLPVFFSPQT